MKWQNVAKVLGSTSIGVFVLVAGLMNLTGMSYSWDGDKVCSDCYSKIQVNSTYWEVCAEHAGNEDVLFKKVSRGRRLWVNMDKVDSVVLTEPYISTEIMVPTIKKYSVVKHEEYGYLRPLKDGDCFIPRKSEKYHPNGGWFVVHGLKGEDVTVKWSFVLDSYFSEGIDIDPYWWGTNTSSEGGLVGYWKFNGNADDETGANNGSVNGAVLTDGRFGSGYSFDGTNDYVVVEGTGSDLNITDTFSISVWVNPKLTSSKALICKGGSAGDPDYLIFHGSVAGAPINSFSFYDSSQWIDLSANASTSVNEFVHLVVTSNGSLLTTYIDGTKANTNSVNVLPSTSDDFYFGSQCDAGASNPFDGVLDEVLVFNRTLSSSEVSDLYQGTKSNKLSLATDPSEGLVDMSGNVLWLDMDGDADDKSGFGNDGSVTGAKIEEGRFGNAYYFDGVNDIIIIPDNESINITGNELTISMWCRFDYIDSISDACYVWKHGSHYATDPGYAFQVSPGYPLIDVYLQSNNSGYERVINGPLDYDWHHYVAVINLSSTDNVRIYIDSIYHSPSYDYTDAMYPILNASGTDLQLGRRYDSRWGHGLIDEVLVFNRSLSASEISALYTGEKSKKFKVSTNPSEGLVDMSGNVLWWHLDGDMTDENGNYDGSVIAGDVTSTDGRFGGGYYFDGVDDIIATGIHVDEINKSKDFSVSLWFNAEDYTANPYNYQLLAGQMGSTSDRLVLMLRHTGSTDTINAGVYNGTSYYAKGTSYEINKWYHVVFNHYGESGDEFNEMWVNSVNITTSGAPQMAGTNRFYIGDSQSIYEYTGRIDEVLVFNRTLTESEIGGLYSGEKSKKLSFTITPG